MSRLNDGELCALCGKPAEGFATIGDDRLCHGDERPSCYEQRSWGVIRASSPDAFVKALKMLDEGCTVIFNDASSREEGR